MGRITPPSIHDSLLTGYLVDGAGRTLVLHTRPHQGGGTHWIDVAFYGLVAYHFEGDALENIVFDVTPVPASTIIGDGKEFAERFRLYGVPTGWDPRRETVNEYFSRVGAQLFELHSSYGMHGWIAAERMEQIVLDSPDSPDS